jgi:hypothetical protein
MSPLAIASIVTGGIALMLCWIPFVAWPLGLAAIVCGTVALVKRAAGKGLSIAGISLGALGALLATLLFVVFLGFAAAAERSSEGSRQRLDQLRSSAASRSAATGVEHTVEYRVTTNAPAKVGYRDASGTFDEQVTAPWTKTFTDTGSYVSGRVSVTVPDYENKDASVSCEVLIDGKTVSRKTDTGRGAYASCSGSLN